MHRLDKIGNVCYYNTMDNFKIYKNGKYDIKANLKMHAKRKAIELFWKFNDSVERLYEV